MTRFRQGIHDPVVWEALGLTLVITVLLALIVLFARERSINSGRPHHPRF